MGLDGMRGFNPERRDRHSHTKTEWSVAMLSLRSAGIASTVPRAVLEVMGSAEPRAPCSSARRALAAVAAVLVVAVVPTALPGAVLAAPAKVHAASDVRASSRGE